MMAGHPQAGPCARKPCRSRTFGRIDERGQLRNEHRPRARRRVPGPLLQGVDNGINTLLRDDTAPLLLAGTEDEIAIYRRVSTHPRLLDRVRARFTGRFERTRVAPAGNGHSHGVVLAAAPKRDCQFRETSRQRPSLSRTQSVIKSAWEGRIADLFLSQRAEVIGDGMSKRIKSKAAVPARTC